MTKEYCNLLLNMGVCIRIPINMPITHIGILHRIGSRHYGFEDYASLLRHLHIIFPEYDEVVLNVLKEEVSVLQEEGYFNGIYNSYPFNNDVVKAKKCNNKKNEKHLYIIKNTVTGRYKIGVSRNPNNRIKVLNLSSDSPLELISVYNGMGIKEKEIHFMFYHKMTNTEWFELDNDDLLTINKILYGTFI